MIDSGTSDPMPDADIIFEDAGTGWPLHGMSDGAGDYARVLPAATYDVTGFRYGYLPGTIAGVVVSAGMTTEMDIPLDPAPIWTVDGTVTETQSGDPLAAQVVFEETPIMTDTDPATGVYSTGVAQGDWWMQVSSPGHSSEDRLVTVDQDSTQDFSLPAIHNYYMKAGDPTCGATYNWMDATGGTAYCLSDDTSRFASLPRPFYLLRDRIYLPVPGLERFRDLWHRQ